MTKRLSEPAHAAAVSAARADPDLCPVCAGAIVSQENDRAKSRFPRRRVCRICGAEAETTEPPEVVY